jgi:trigger factor
MNVTVSRISPVLMELSVEVPADLVKVEVDKAYANLAKKAHVRGFRPGKAPRQVLTHLFGPQVASDVANNIVNETLPKALTDKKVTPVSQPAVEAGKVDAAAAFSYKARFEVQPDIEDVKFEGFELKRPSIVVTEKMVEEQLEQLRNRHAALKSPDPVRPAKKGDVVTIDFKLSIEGKEVKEGGGEGVQLELGAGQALPELDAGLAGKNNGETAKIEAKFPEGHPREDFRGKTGEFTVTVTDVKERVLSALDDEFAKDVGSFQTLVELRADIHTKLEKMLKDRSETSLAEQIVVKLNESNPCEVPPSLVEQQCQLMEQEVAMQARRMGQRFTREQAQGLHEQIHRDAEKKVRAGLLMAAIARKNNFKVTDEDIERGLAELAEETGKNVAKLRAEYREKAKRDILVGMILEDKILDFIEGKSKISDAPEESEEAGGDNKKDDKKRGKGPA